MENKILISTNEIVLAKRDNLYELAVFKDDILYNDFTFEIEENHIINIKKILGESYGKNY